MKTLKSVSGIHGASPFGQNNKVKTVKHKQITYFDLETQQSSYGYVN